MIDIDNELIHFDIHTQARVCDRLYKKLTSSQQIKETQNKYINCRNCIHYFKKNFFTKGYCTHIVFKGIKVNEHKVCFMFRKEKNKKLN